MTPALPLRRAFIRALPGTGTPRLHPVASAARDLERAWQQLCDASDRWTTAPLGDTDQLVARTDRWKRAVDEYETARVRLGEALARREGRTLLRVCEVNRD